MNDWTLREIEELTENILNEYDIVINRGRVLGFFNI